MNNISELIYHSRSPGQVDLNLLADIRNTSLVHNSAHQITGALFYCFGRFIQVLEGPAEPVNELYNNIVSDSRHQRACLISYRQISQRNFSMWSMKVITAGEEDTALVKMLVRHTGYRLFDPENWPVEKALAFLIDASRTIPEI